MSMSRPNSGTGKKSPLDIAVLQVLLVPPLIILVLSGFASADAQACAKVSFIASCPVLERLCLFSFGIRTFRATILGALHLPLEAFNQCCFQPMLLLLQPRASY